MKDNYCLHSGHKLFPTDQYQCTFILNCIFSFPSFQHIRSFKYPIWVLRHTYVLWIITSSMLVGRWEKNSDVVFDIKLYQKVQQLMEKCKVQKKRWCLVVKEKRNKGHFRNLTIPQNKKHERQKNSRKTKLLKQWNCSMKWSGCQALLYSVKRKRNSNHDLSHRERERESILWKRKGEKPQFNHDD